MRNAIQGILLLGGLLLMFGGVGYMELGGSCWIGTLESLIGAALMLAASKMEPKFQPKPSYQIYHYQPYRPQQPH